MTDEELVEDPRRRAMRRRVAILVLAAFLVPSIFGVFQLISSIGGPRVPDFSGLTLDQAERAREDQRIRLHPVTGEGAPLCAGREARVVAQRPEPGSKIVLPADVALLMSCTEGGTTA